jgi:hypothetical protein
MTLPRCRQRSTKSLFIITSSACREKDRETFLVIGLGEGPTVQYRLRTPATVPLPALEISSEPFLRHGQHSSSYHVCLLRHLRFQKLDIMHP